MRTREEMKDTIYELIKETNQLVRETEMKADNWENLVSSQLWVVEHWENLTTYCPVDEHKRKLDKEYRRYDLYCKMEKASRYKLDELEQALCGLEKAMYWL